MVDRVHSSNARIYVNNSLLIGVSNYDLSYNLNHEPIKNLNYYNNTDRILKSKQSPELSLSWTLGDQSTDPFLDFQTSGIVSVESFNIKMRDVVGERIVSGCYLTSYSLKAAVGSLISASVKYEGNSVNLSTGNPLSLNDQTSDYYNAYLPQKIELTSTFENGNIVELPVQSFDINIPISRTPFGKLNDFEPKYKLPNLPIEATINFSAIKNLVTGIDLTSILLEKGNFNFSLKSCSETNDKDYSIGDCSLVSVSESLDLEGNAIINFNYISSLTNSNFSLGSFLIDALGTTLLSNDGFTLSYTL